MAPLPKDQSPKIDNKIKKNAVTPVLSSILLGAAPTEEVRSAGCCDALVLDPTLLVEVILDIDVMTAGTTVVDATTSADDGVNDPDVKEAEGRSTPSSLICKVGKTYALA
jgi:hypothetical protein